MMAFALGFGNVFVTHGSEFFNVMNDKFEIQQVTREPLLRNLQKK